MPLGSSSKFLEGIAAFQKTVFMEKSTRNGAAKKEARQRNLGPKIRERQNRVLAVQEAPGLVCFLRLSHQRQTVGLGGSQRSCERKGSFQKRTRILWL